MVELAELRQIGVEYLQDQTWRESQPKRLLANLLVEARKEHQAAHDIPPEPVQSGEDEPDVLGSEGLSMQHWWMHNLVRKEP